MQNMVPGNAITTYYTPNMYAYNLTFAGNQSQLRRRAGHRDGRHHHGHRVRRPAQQHEGADEVRPRGGTRAPGFNGARGARATEDSIR